MPGRVGQRNQQKDNGHLTDLNTKVEAKEREHQVGTREVEVYQG